MSKNKDNIENCSICFENIDENDRAVTKCKHVFHLHCLIKNVKTNNSTGENCPICRNILIDNNLNTNDDNVNTNRDNGNLNRDLFGEILSLDPNLFNSYFNEMTGILPVSISTNRITNRNFPNTNSIVYHRTSSTTNNGNNLVTTTVSRDGNTNSISQLTIASNRGLSNSGVSNRFDNRRNYIRTNYLRREPLPMQRNLTTNDEIISWIKGLSFSELKNELRRNGLSQRGYIRDRLEDRLLYKLVGDPYFYY
jgi:hypothetical protein